MLFLVLLLNISMTPWILHIGGRFTPTTTWTGYGTVSASNGARYGLYIDFRGGLVEEGRRGMKCSQFGCDTMTGTAQMCSARSPVQTYTLAGAVHTWWNTDGAKTTISLTGGKPTKLPSGWVVSFSGAWHGPQLTVTDHDNSFTEVFTPTGAIRTTTSTSDAGTATVTLNHGSKSDFEKSCRQLTGH